MSRPPMDEYDAMTLTVAAINRTEYHRDGLVSAAVAWEAAERIKGPDSPEELDARRLLRGRIHELTGLAFPGVRP